MKVSREQAAANRERVVDTAARLFRRHGFDGVPISDLMKAAGLTHGGFYGRFASKDALEREACARGARASVAKVAKVADAQARTSTRADENDTAGVPVFHQFIDAYLSTRHRDNPEDGCTVAALAGDAGRCDALIQEVFAEGVRGMAAELGRAEAHAYPTSTPDAGGSSPDFAMLACIVGAVVLARAVAAADPALSGLILTETKERLTTNQSQPGTCRSSKASA
jgi:TetR/AcrR family transcriptional repressor of nem operon